MNSKATKTKERNIGFKKGIEKITAAGRKMKGVLKSKLLEEGIAGPIPTVTAVACTVILATGCWAGGNIGENKAPEEGNDTVAGESCEDNYVEPNSLVADATTIVMDEKGDFAWTENVWADAQTAGEYMEIGLPGEGYWTISYEFEGFQKGKGIPETTGESKSLRMDRRISSLHYDGGNWLLVKLSYEEDVVSLGKIADACSLKVGEHMPVPTGEQIELIDVDEELNENGEHNVTIVITDGEGEPVSGPLTLAPGELVSIVVDGKKYWLRVNRSSTYLEEKHAYLQLLTELKILEGGTVDEETGVHVELDWNSEEEYPVLEGIEIYTC